MALSSWLPSSVKTLVSDYDIVNSFLFQPPREASYTHKEVLWMAGSDVPVIQVQTKLHKNTPLEKDPLTIVFFHGNACDLGDTRQFVENLADQCKVNVISVEYPGYGVLNDTTPRTSVFLAACTKIVLHILTRLDVLPSRLVLFGQSLGGAAALHVAAYLHEYHQMRVGGVITQSAFASVQGTAAAISSRFLGSWLGPLCSSLCVVERLDNLKAVSQLHPRTPLLLMHGDKDDVIPFSHMQLLFNARASTNSTAVVARDANHNNISDRFVFQNINSFITKFIGH